GQVPVPGLLVHMGDHVGGEVDDLLEVLRRDVEQVAQPARDALEVPDVGHRGGQLDVAHSVTAHVGAGDLDATALTDDALEPHPLVLAAVALPVPGGTEDLLAEQAVTLRLERAVVDGLRLLDLAVGPVPDLVGGGQADPDLVEEVHVQHVASLFLWFRAPHPAVGWPGAACEDCCGTGSARPARGSRGPDASTQTSSTPAIDSPGRRERSMPKSSAAR